MSVYFSHQLALLGWDSYFDEKFKRFALEGGVPARVVADFGTEYLVHDGADVWFCSEACGTRYSESRERGASPAR